MKIVIMSGGRGTRFWPASRSRKPKQFLSIAGRKTLLQQTCRRLLPLVSESDIFFVCGAEYADLVREQMPGVTQEQLILEPTARNTAPCIGLAAGYLLQRFPEEIMAVLPSDHLIGDVATFQRMLKAAEGLARDNWLVTFGIQPTRAATGYGYIEAEAEIGSFSGFPAFSVRRFTEKPDQETARAYVRGGQHFWNSGMFVWRPATILEEIAAAQPRLAAGLDEFRRHADQPVKARQLFEALPCLSIDHAVMEHSERVAVLPARFDWDDVGDWRVLMDHLGREKGGNRTNTSLVSLDAQNCLAHSDRNKLVALLGVENLVVVDTEDALLVCHRERTQDIKTLIEELEDKFL